VVVRFDNIGKIVGHHCFHRQTNLDSELSLLTDQIMHRFASIQKDNIQSQIKRKNNINMQDMFIFVLTLEIQLSVCGEFGIQ
jgi:hypothetical protein